MSTRGWSGALPSESQASPTPKDVRGALCQVRCPERNKEIIDRQTLFVSSYNLSIPVNLLQECDNKQGKNPVKLTVVHTYILKQSLIGFIRTIDVG